MSVEYTPNDKNGYVETATADMARAHLDKIEHDARANVTTAKQESVRAETAEKDMAGHKNPGNAEATVYGNLAAHALAPGAQLVSNVTDFFDARRSDAAAIGFNAKPQEGKTNGIVSGKAKTMEQHIIGGTTRTPGLYRETPNPIHYEGQIKTAASGASAKKSNAGGEDLMARANIAQSSLNGQGKGAIASWAVEKPKMDSVAQAKKLTFGQELMNEQALDSVYVARLQQQAMMQKAQQMAPGMGMGSGPSMKMSDIQKMAEDENRLNQWRESGTA